MIKLQIGCLLVILFIATIYFSVKRVKTISHLVFSLSLIVTAVNLVFDMITMYTVNHLETVNSYVNRGCHILFLGSMIFEIYICFWYSNTLIYDDEEKIKKNNLFFQVTLWIAWACLILLPLEYKVTPKGNYSWGLPVYTVYIFGFIYMGVAIFMLIKHWKQVNSKKRSIVMIAYVIQLCSYIYQGMVPTALMSSLGLTLINLAFFLTVESPDVHLIESLKYEKERADEANQAKTQFLSNMSHEIRTPMNAIVGLTEVLLREDWGEQEMKYLHNIKSSGDALLSLINDLLDFSKVEAGKFVISEENYEPLDMVENLEPIFKNRIGDKKVRFETNIDSSLPKVLYGDGMRIRQIIINLVNNAIKFTDEGFVKLSLKVRKTEKDKVELLVSVRDSGIGIREEDLDKLFDAFTQVDLKKNKAKEGTGLGLAICKQLVELMGGKIGVNSEYGKGSNFYFILPQKAVGDETVGDRQKDDTDSGKYRSQTEFGFTLPDTNVLLVDDNSINRMVAKALLEPLKMNIDVAENGYEALQMVQSKKYQLVFMDHYMPVMDGLEATKRIRELPDEYYKNLPILALTADAVAGEKEKFLNAGMNDVVSKPIQIKEICEKIKHYVK